MSERKMVKDKARAYPHSTGEFVVPGLKSDCKMATAIFNNELHVIGGNPDASDDYRAHYLKHMKFPLKKLRSRDTTDWKDSEIKKTENWSEVKFNKDWVYASSPYDWTDSGGSGSLTYSDNTSLVSSSTALWLFRLTSDNDNISIVASKCQSIPAKGENDPPRDVWGKDIKLYNPGGKQDYANRVQKFGAISACLFGETQFLLAGCGTTDAGPYSTSNETISLYLFDINDIKEDDSGNSTWTARSCRTLDIRSDITFYMGNQPEKRNQGFHSGIKLDMDWFYTMKPDPNDAKKSVPEYYLTLGIAPSIPWRQSYTWTGFVPLPVSTEGDNEGDIVDNPWGNGKLDFYNQGDGIESAIKRDPSGRLQRFSRYNTENNKIEFSSLYFSTAEPPTVANGFGNREPGVSPTFTVSEDTTVPVNNFYTFEPGKKETETFGVGYDKQKKLIKATEYPVLEFIFYGSNKCQLHDYGTILVAHDKQHPVSKSEIEEVIVGGYFDAPIPIPLENFVGQELSNNELNVGSFTYTTKNSKEKEAGLETGWTMGYEADGKTTEGLGPAFKVSADGGMGSTKKETVSSDLELSMPVDATVKSSGDFKNPTLEGPGVFTAVSARLLLTGYQFRDAKGNLVNDALSGNKSQSPKIGAVLTRMTPADTPFYTFDPFTVEKGNLESYTAPAINERMKKLGYKGDNYFGDIICKNAYPIGGINDYLTLGWSDGDSNTVEEFQTKSTFTEQSWTFDTSIYGGISGGGGIDFFGIGEEFEFSFMAGGTYSRDRTESNLESSGWGVSISEGWGPIVPKEDLELKNWISSYSFRMYFLPVPKSPSTLPANYWTKELANYTETLRNLDGEKIDQKIDTGSGSWRIAFVVTKINYCKGSDKKDYLHDQTLDNPSVYS